jgi:hypothetical protein
VRSLLVLCLALIAAAPAAAADTVVGTMPGRPYDFSAWGGHAVFSVYDQASGSFTLYESEAGGIAPAGVATFTNAPEPDVGPDAAGRPVAVYRRCADVAQLDCPVYELALGQPAAQERRLSELDVKGTSIAAPTIWKGRIAFGRMRHNRVANVYVQRSPGSRRVRLLGRGTVPDCQEKGCAVDAYPVAMDLGPTGLAMVWDLAGGDAIPQEDEELWRVPLDGRPGTLLDVGVAGECGFGGRFSFSGFASPVVVGSRVAYLRVRGDCYESDSAFVLGGPSPLASRVHRVGGTHLAYAAARDGAGWWWVRGPNPSDELAADNACKSSDCSLIVSTVVRLRKVRVRRVPQPPLDPAFFGSPRGGPRTPAALHRYIAAHYAIFRVRPRAVDALPAVARRSLGRGTGSRFLARLAGYAAYAVPRGGSDLCLALVSRTFESDDCEPAVTVLSSTNVFPRITLPHRRLLFVALIPDGASGVTVANPQGYRRTLHPYRNTVARLLPGSQGSHDWTLRWARRGKRYKAAFS